MFNQQIFFESKFLWIKNKLSIKTLQKQIWTIFTLYRIIDRKITNPFVGPEIWGPSPLCIKGPKPRPRSPTAKDAQWKLLEGPQMWLRTTLRPTSHKNAWRKGQIQYKSSTREKAASTLMWNPSPDKPILIPCYPAFPNHSDVRIDKTSNHPK